MKDLAVGVIGCGHISATHLRGWRKSPIGRVRRVFDRDPAAANAAARRFSIDEISSSVEELIEQCDVVDICTPPGSHSVLLQQALKAGRHVLIEKPVVIDPMDWESVSPLLTEKTRLAVVHHLKFTECVRQAKSWIESGAVGRVLRLDWRFLTSPRSDRMLTQVEHWSHSLPGGRWLETLPHNLYLIHYLAGRMGVDAISVLPSERAPTEEPADEVRIILKQDDCLASIDFSAHCELNVRMGTIIGTHGIIRLDLLSNLATLERKGDGPVRRAMGISLLSSSSRVVQSLAQQPRVVGARLLGWTPHARLISSFASHLRTDGPNPTPVEEIDFVVRSCDEIGRRIEQCLS